MTSVFTEIDGGLRVRSAREVMDIEASGPHGLRCRASPYGPPGDPLRGEGALLDLRPGLPEVRIDDTGARIRNGDTEARITPDGRVSWHRGGDGRLLVAEAQAETCGRPGRRLTPLSGGLFRAELTLEAYPREALFGLGQQQHGRLDQKGCTVDLLQRNTEVTVPFLLSNRGYGLLWHNPAVGRVELATNHTRWVAEASVVYDLWVVAGDRPAEILERYTEVSGRAPVMPDWALGLWQCRLRYASQEEVLGVAREFRERSLPLSALVIDGGHWTRMGEWRFDAEDWPDPGAMVRELREEGVTTVVSVWPTVNPDAETSAEMASLGLLVRCSRGPDLPERMLDVDKASWQRLHVYDATHPGARAYLMERIQAGYGVHGIEAFWLDADEPEVNPLEPDNLHFHLGPGSAWHNLYPLAHSRGFFEGLTRAGVREPLTLNRSAWAGSQRYAAAVWSGDIECSFDALRRQVVAGLNMGLSGIPWWTTDIGGFKGGDPDEPAFRELLVRWFQFATVCPILRMHGFRLSPGEERADSDVTGANVHALMQDLDFRRLNGGPNEPWSFGARVLSILRVFLAVRDGLRPYLRELTAEASASGAPPMRPLFWDFPGDEACWRIDDSFMLGPDLLAAPVLQAGARSRSVYLPGAAAWISAWTGQPVPAGETNQSAPLTTLPLFLRAGSRLAAQWRGIFRSPAAGRTA